MAGQGLLILQSYTASVRKRTLVGQAVQLQLPHIQNKQCMVWLAMGM